MMKWLSVVLSVCTLISLSVRAEQLPFTLQGPQVTIIESIKGVNIGYAKTMVQSADGYLWIGTGNGLMRFDGIDVVHYFSQEDNANSLSSNNIIAMVEDRLGALWMATAFGGLNRFDPATKQFSSLMHDPNDPTSMPSNNSMVVAKRDENSLWFGHTKGLEIIDIHTQTRQPVDFTGFDQVVVPTRVVTDNQGHVWIGTVQSGLFRFDEKTGRSIQFIHDKDNEGSLNGGFITSLTIDGENRLWVASLSGISILDLSTNKIVRLQHDNPQVSDVINRQTTLFTSQNGDVWIGDNNDGLVVYNAKQKQFNYLAVASGYLFSIYQDRQQSIWMATTKGLVRIHPHALKYTYLAPNDRGFASYHVDAKQQIWLVNPLGIYQFDAVTKQIKQLKALDGMEFVRVIGDHLYALRVTEQSNVVVERYALADLSFIETLYSQPFKAGNYIESFIHQQGSLWWSMSSFRPDGETGLYELDITTKALNIHSFEPRINEALKLSDQSLLLATSNGLVRFDNKQTKFTSLDFARLKQKEISCLYQNNAQVIWFCIRDKGLGRYQIGADKVDIFAWATSDIRSIVQDALDTLWLGTKEGNVRFDPDSGQFRRYNEAMGVPGVVHFQPLAVRVGEQGVFQSALNGNLYFEPRQLIDIKAQVDTLITGFSVLNQPVEPNLTGSILTKAIEQTNKLTLTHQDYVFSFTFATLDFLQPQSLQYAFKMEGLDKQWFYTDADRRIATYTTLPAGQYTFKVKGSDSYGTWNEGTAINIVILPPWWASLTAYVIYALTACVLIYLFVYLRTRRLALTAQQLQQGITERTQELAQRSDTIRNLLSVKDRLFANVSHEFRTPLTLILGPIQRMLDNDKETANQDLLLLVKANANRLLGMVDQLLDIAKSQSYEPAVKQVVDVIDVANFLIESFQSLAQLRGIELKLSHGKTQKVLVKVETDGLEKILSNLLTNALKYSGDNTAIELQIDADDEQVRLIVSDQGVGIDEQDIEQIFDRFTRLDNSTNYVPGAGIGLALVKQLVENAEGTIAVQSKQDVGSRFIVTLPRYNGSEIQSEQANIALMTAQAQQIVLSEASLSRTTNEEQDESKPHVLIIEDNADMRDYIASCLNDKYNISTQNDGEQGLAFALEHLPDLVISDVMMPKKDGFAVAQALKSHALTAHIPLILLTAHGDRQSRIKGWSQLVDEYLHKPFDATELAARVENLLSIRLLIRQRGQRSFVETPPDTASDIEFTNEADKALFTRMDEVLAKHYDNEMFNVTEFAQILHISPRQLSRKTKHLMDLGPAEIIRTYRLKQAAKKLSEGAPVGNVALDTGFTSHSYFSRCFKAQYGCLPSKYKK